MRYRPIPVKIIVNAVMVAALRVKLLDGSKVFAEENDGRLSVTVARAWEAVVAMGMAVFVVIDMDSVVVVD